MSAVKTYASDTPGDKMRQHRQVRRIHCDAAEACDCGVGCPTCKGLGHTFLGIDPGRGRRFRCIACRAEFLGPDMFAVINRAGSDRHIVGFLCGQTRCGCIGGICVGKCWAQDHVREFCAAEAERAEPVGVPLRGISDLGHLPSGPPRASRRRPDGHMPSVATAEVI